MRIDAMQGEAMRDEADFAAFYAAHHAAIWAYLARLGASPAVASDLAQDTFVRWLERDETKVQDNARAYLYKVALHLFIDHVRRSKREVAWDAVTEVAAPEAERIGVIPHRIWSQLTLRQRQLLWLAYAEGFSHEEIAGITGLGADSIRVLLSRARARFQALQEERIDG
ncbi:RNA polymerase sigma factor [Lysobacter sp. A6]|uniref:RNA polymerase sigma factor n=1 Tax=Noviluteimonas lactosilytica TaxID=2888523 RepID=A0ABS8JI12_9GAMM|nr:RNA polymerase sigma factor [Lysobacter lactosilyticus]MCC8363221.1 RNA polymerase sigma factor [Lysobacter lactosilyticus]